MASMSREEFFERLNWHPSFLLRPFVRAPFRVAGSSESVKRRCASLSGRRAPLWTITTYERPDVCERLVASLGQSARDAGLEPIVIVIRDAGPSDYTEVSAALEREFGERGVLIESKRRLGKPGFWRLHQVLFDIVRALDPPYHLSLQDDVEPIPGWYSELWSIVEAIDDPDLAVLYMVAADDDEPGGRWVEFDRVDAPDGRSRLTQWFDLQAFLAMPRMYEVLAWRMLPVARSRWEKNPTQSSGVARQIARRFFGRDANVHQVVETLVYHGAHASLMNPEARAERSLDNRPTS